ncbi:MAG: ATP synthase F1 subunit delta [Lachnospiraceae bacterium]|nr:ATP synthase F1 subunit delta [Lachnospiraceae bacterium]
MAKLVSKTYGDALFELAVEQKKLDAISEEAVCVRELLKENAELIKLLNLPKLSVEEKVSVTETIFKGRVSEEMTGFLVTIVEKGRYNEIDDIFGYFDSKVKEYKNIGVVTVTSAAELNKAQREKIEARLLATTGYASLEVKYGVDASLIGGMVIRIGDRVADSSIKTRLSNLSKNLLKVSLS